MKMMSGLVCALSISLASCAGITTKREEITLSVGPDVAPGQPVPGYQKIIVSTFDPIGFCRDSFVGKLGRALFRNSDKSIMTLMLDDAPISIFIYDKGSNSCTKQTGGYLSHTDFERNDTAGEGKHTVKLAYVEEHQVSGFEVALGFATALTSLPIASQEVVSKLSVDIDNAIAKSLSGNSTISHGFVTPSAGPTRFDVTSTIKGVPYKIAQFDVVSKTNMIDEIAIQNGVMSMRLMDKLTIKKQLDERRTNNDRSLISGDVSTARLDCDYLIKRYSDVLNVRDMKMLREYYLIENHENIVRPELLEACRLPNTPPELSMPLRVMLENYFNSARENQGTQFMVDFIATPESDAPLLSKKWSYAPQGFDYQTVGQLLNAGLQQPPGCYSFSRKDRNTFYFSMPVKLKTYYFVAQLDRSYTREEEAEGKRSKILSLGVTDIFQNAGAGECQEQKKACGPAQSIAEG